MRALLLDSLDGPGALRVAEVDEPGPAPGSALIEVAGAGLSYPDLLLTQGRYQYRPDPPFIPGCEVSGTVVEAPPGSGLQIGQRVCAYTELGGFAERVRVDADRVLELPDGLDPMTAAGMPINYLTMHFGLCVRGRLAAGETVLVHGAGGGVGLAAVQVGRAWGARVIAVASSEDKRRAALAAGADAAIPVEGFRDEVERITGGVDIVVDPVGGDRVTDSLRCLRPLGRLLVLGFTSGDIATIKTNRLLLNNLDAVGVGWGAFAYPRPGYMREQWTDLMTAFAASSITPMPPRVVPLASIPAELADMEQRALAGKVVASLRA